MTALMLVSMALCYMLCTQHAGLTWWATMAMLTWMIAMIAMHTRRQPNTDKMDQMCEILVQQGNGDAQEIATIIGGLDSSWV